MQRTLGIIVVAVLTFILGASLMRLWDRPAQPVLPPAPVVITQMRDVARLETLDVTVFKKVAFRPEPEPSDSFWRDVKAWAKFNLLNRHGKALVFADVHVGLPFNALDERHLRLQGRRAEVALPPLSVTVSLRPGDMEVIESNLDSQQTAELLELARIAFEREALANPVLRARAQASAERSLRALLQTLGFEPVVFVTSTGAAL